MAGPSGTAREDALMWMAASTSFMVLPAWGQWKKTVPSASINQYGITGNNL
jgi:hypothetical protein